MGYGVGQVLDLSVFVFLGEMSWYLKKSYETFSTIYDGDFNGI